MGRNKGLSKRAHLPPSRCPPLLRCARGAALILALFLQAGGVAAGTIGGQRAAAAPSAGRAPQGGRQTQERPCQGKVETAPSNKFEWVWTGRGWSQGSPPASWRDESVSLRLPLPGRLRAVHYASLFGRSCTVFGGQLLPSWCVVACVFDVMSFARRVFFVCLHGFI